MSDQLIITEAPELNGVEKSKADQIKETFEPMVAMLKEFEDTYNGVIEDSKKGIDNEITQRAKRLRLDIAKVRIETEKLRKEQKEEYLRAGKAIDGVGNILKWAVSEKENQLKEIETYFERLEAERLIELQKTRAQQLHPYLEHAFEMELSGMPEDVWNAYFAAKKKEHEDKIAAEKEAAERAKAEAERLKKEAAERAEREAKLKAEREQYEAKLKSEREERERAEAELKAKQAAEKAEAERIEAERIAAEKKKAEAGDLEKLYILLNDLKKIELPDVDSAVAKDVCAVAIASVSATCQEIKDTIILIEQ